MASYDYKGRWQDIVQFYHHLTFHIVPGPNTPSYAIPCLLLPTALFVPPSVLSHNQLALLFLPVIYACQLHAWVVGGIDVIGVNLVLWSFVLLVVRDPRRTHRRLWVFSTITVGDNGDGKGGLEGGRKDGDEVVEEPYPKDMRKRIPWVLTLLVSLRLTGWRIGDPSHDKTQPTPRLKRSDFLRIALPTVVFGFLIMDATSLYVETDSYFTTSKMSVDAPFSAPSKDLPTLLIVLRLLPPRLLRSSILAGQVYAMVTSMFFLPTIPAVGLNAIGLLHNEWSPHTWPVFFGSFSKVWERGLRGLWGGWWHSMNRQITATLGHELAKSMGIPTRSLLAFGMLTVSAFFFSGVIHVGMIPPEPESKLMSANEMRLYIAGFFWLQIPAFAIELAVTKMARRFVPSVGGWRITKALVLAWVASWMCLTLPLLTVPLREIGYWRYYAVPISLLRGLAGKAWLTW